MASSWPYVPKVDTNPGEARATEEVDGGRSRQEYSIDYQIKQWQSEQMAKRFFKDRELQESRAKKTYDLEALEELLAALIEASGQGAATIVEGRRDEQALRSLGLTGPIVMASRRPALDLAEDAARSYPEIILLTDWDKKGDEMARIIERHLWSAGSRPDRQIRSRLKKLVRKEIKDVESLSNYMERMRELYGP